MSNVFKDLLKLKDELELTKKRLPQHDTDGKALIVAKLNLVYEIGKYVGKYEWKGDLKDRMATYLDYNCSIKVLCDKYGITVNAAELCIHRASKTIWGKIGQSTLALIKVGSVEDARDLFYFRSGKYKIKDFVLNEVAENLPKQGKYMTLNVEECLTELNFLHVYSKNGFNRALQKVDKFKLSYLIYILEEDSLKLAKYRPLIKDLLTDKGYSEIKEQIKNL
jgi:hypothetical protein|nr:hypothetical protein [uncultured Lachnoclostridium sp.]